jgi:PDDEXK-like domain of unknown function (DUF3799)
MDPYFGRNEVSNSDLTWLKNYYQPEMDEVVKEKAYRFGSLLDAIITEPFKVNYFKKKVEDVQYTDEEFEKAEQMKKSFLNDPFAKNILSQSDMQKVMIVNRNFTYEDDMNFKLDVRCKWDLWMQNLGWGGDLKSTTATTQKQFEEAVRYFDYDRQRAWYMDIAGSNQDVLIGVSKVNFKVFKVPIRRDDELYKSGFRKYNELAFKWWALFEM